MTGVLCAIVGTSGSGVLDTEDITVDTFTDGMSFEIRGFASGVMGSIVDGLFAPKSGATITNFYYDVPSQVLIFSLSGTYTNAGWTTVTVGTTDFTRSAAAFTTPGGNTQWEWTGITLDPFGADSTVTTAVFK
jgi:hypothetical protein